MRWASGYAANLNGVTPFEKDINLLSHDVLKSSVWRESRFRGQSEAARNKTISISAERGGADQFLEDEDDEDQHSTVLTNIAMDVAACTHTYTHIMIDREVIVWE